MKSMWFVIRKIAGKTQTDVAKEFGVSPQYIHKMETGETNMPIKYQVYYLSLRNTDEDKIIIQYLKDLQRLYKENY